MSVLPLLGIVGAMLGFAFVHAHLANYGIQTATIATWTSASLLGVAAIAGCVFLSAGFVLPTFLGDGIAAEMGIAVNVKSMDSIKNFSEIYLIRTAPLFLLILVLAVWFISGCVWLLLAVAVASAAAGVTIFRKFKRKSYMEHAVDSLEALQYSATFIVVFLIWWLACYALVLYSPDHVVAVVMSSALILSMLLHFCISMIGTLGNERVFVFGVTFIITMIVALQGATRTASTLKTIFRFGGYQAELLVDGDAFKALPEWLKPEGRKPVGIESANINPAAEGVVPSGSAMMANDPQISVDEALLTRPVCVVFHFADMMYIRDVLAPADDCEKSGEKKGFNEDLRWEAAPVIAVSAEKVVAIRRLMAKPTASN